MAGDDSSVRQGAEAGRDAFVAGHDLVINFVPPQASRRAGWNVPARNPAFIGRESLLAGVQEAMATGKRAAVQALCGIGGVGKTQIAIEYAHRWSAGYEVVWWVDAADAEVLSRQFAELAVDLGCVHGPVPRDMVRRSVMAALRVRESWLLVFDNAENIEVIAPWLPGGKGHVLITSRAYGWDEIAVPVEVGVLDRTDSMALLRTRMPGLREADAELVSDAMGDLPLGLAQAARYMAETGLSAGEYTILLKEWAREILAEGRPPLYPKSLAAVTELAFGQLGENYPAAAEVARTLAFLEIERVPIDWFVKAAAEMRQPPDDQTPHPFTWRRALVALGRSGLARVDRDGLVMHRLTRAIVRSYLMADQADQAGDARRRAAAVLAANDPMMQVMA